MDWTAFIPLYLTASVEWVEAFTIVLAVSLTIGWGASLGAAAAGLVTLLAAFYLVGGQALVPVVRQAHRAAA